MIHVNIYYPPYVNIWYTIHVNICYTAHLPDWYIIYLYNHIIIFYVSTLSWYHITHICHSVYMNICLYEFLYSSYMIVFVSNSRGEKSIRTKLFLKSYMKIKIFEKTYFIYTNKSEIHVIMLSYKKLKFFQKTILYILTCIFVGSKFL